MSDYMKQQHARQDFREFVIDLLASQARHVAPHEPDPPAVATVEVRHNEVIDAFVAIHPEHSQQRAVIEEVFAGEQLFSLAAERWRRVKQSLE